MRRRRTALVLLTLALPSGLALQHARAETAPAPSPWQGRPTLVSGSARYDRGEWIHTDYVYDDYGANTGSWGQPNVVSLAGTSGDARYPLGPSFAGNAADIVEVRVRPRSGALQVRVLLQTIVDPAVVAVSAQVGDAAPNVFTQANATVDATANTVSFVLPRAAVGDSVRLLIGAGLNDGAGGLRAGVPGNQGLEPDEYTTGGPTENRLFDLAFNTRELEPRGAPWNEDAQSAALASGDLTAFAQRIDLAKLRRGQTTPPPRGPGYYVRIFRSAQALGEGVGGSFPQYRGRWQPYALWVPEGHVPAAHTPLFLNLHSLSVHHNQYRGGTNGTYRTFYEQTGDELGALVATPLGRGPNGWYSDEALVDTLEVWADVQQHYTVDRERTTVGGYSMGGYGTYRLTTILPDAFASAVSVVGPPGNGIWAYPADPPGGEDAPDWTYPQLENTRHVPFFITHGALDELVPVTGVAQQAERLAVLGHEHRFALHPAEDHLSFGVKDDWRRETAWQAAHMVRVRNPHRVTYDVRPASWATDGDGVILGHLRRLTRAVGARLDGAYWVSGVQPAGSGDVTGTVDLTSGGIGRRVTGTSPVLSAGVDGPSPHRLTGLDVTHGDGGRTDELTGTLTDVAALRVDLGRAGLSDRPVVRVTSNRAATLTLVRSGIVVRTVTVPASS